MNKIKNKNLIINDPIYGFITINNPLIYNIIENKFFQRLRRICQLSVSNLTYPGATHTRFHHSLGAYHLMTLALNILKSKNINISDEEYEAAQIAILLHDVGHGPFSHTLEGTIINNISHEKISIAIMKLLNKEFNNKLDLAIKIFNNDYERNFFYQLISSQLDVDRLDYLTRDSFYTGVAEGVVGYDRIINMMNVYNNQLVIEEKGVYSIEKFLISRRIMYWQVYYHKTVWATEQLVINIFKRIKFISKNDKEFLKQNSIYDFLHNIYNTNDNKYLDTFNLLDDSDIILCIKQGSKHKDIVLNKLCNAYLNRNLYKVKIYNNKSEIEDLKNLKKIIIKEINITEKELEYFVIENEINKAIYNNKKDKIKILYKNNIIKEITEIDSLIISATLKTTQSKYYQGVWRKQKNPNNNSGF